MRIIILTQDDNLYLPASLAYVCQQLGGRVVCLVSSPVMSTHGGVARGVLRHVRLFGLPGTTMLAARILRSKVMNVLSRPGPAGPFHAIRQVATAFRIPFYHLRKVNSEAFHRVLDRHRPDLLISLSCPQIIGKAVRERIPQGCINVHGSPLPRYRGLMPAFWVLRQGEVKTAVTVHDLEAKLDDGDILLQWEVGIAPQETWDSLVRKTKTLGARALVEAVHQMEAGTVTRTPNRQEEGSYYSFPKAADRKAFRSRGRRFF